MGWVGLLSGDKTHAQEDMQQEVIVGMCHLTAASGGHGGAWLLTLEGSYNRMVTPSLRHILEGIQARCDSRGG